MNEDMDMLDQIAVDRAKIDPEAPRRWACVKLVQSITEARIRKGLTQTQVAERMGVPQPRVADIERRPWSPSLSRVMAYAEAVGVEIGIVGDL